MTAPLPPGARRLWFAEAFADGAPLHNNPAVFRLAGPVSVEALRRAADLVVARHPVLRTTFDEVDGEPVGRVGPVGGADLVVRTVPAADAAGFAARSVREPFDLRTGPLFRIRLGRITPTDHILVINTHHAVVDGRSLSVLCGEIGALYADPARPLPDPGAPPDIIDHDPSRRVSDLDGVPDLLTLPTDRPRPRMRAFRGELRRHAVPEGLTARVDALARATRATRFVVLQAAYAATLGTTAGQDDVVVATLVSGRPGPEFADVVGMFVNPVPLRVGIGGDPTFRELVARARRAVAAGLGGAAVPFDRIVEAAGASRDPSHAPLCQAHLVIQDPPEVVLPGVRACRMLPDTGTADVDLTVMVESGGAEMAVVTEHDTDLFDGATVDGVAGRLLALLDRACADPDRRLSALTARPSVVAGPVAGPAGAPAPSTVLELIRFGADGLAVGELSYAELERRSAALASVLRAKGAGPEVWIAVDLPRGTDLVVAVLGIWRAGAVYVPVEPSWPEPRRRAVTGAARVVLTGIPDLPEEFVRVDPGITPESLAYVFHTSGSTGRPKAVGVPHRAVAGMLARSTALVGVGAGDAVAAMISPAFDISLWELVGPLTVGARVVAVPTEIVVDGPALVRRLTAEAVTVVQVTPSVWAVLEAAGGVPERVRVRVSIGEVLTPELAGSLGGAELWNAYGPTETTIWSTAERVHRGRPFGIGEPLDGVAVYLLNAGLRPVDDDVVGEVYLGGFPLARGYLGAPGRSATRFVADPFSPVPGARMYATGDLARRRPGGVVEFVGRVDAQLKVRGHRVEPAEVEAALRADPQIADARVAGDGDRLVAYVVPGAGRPRWPRVRERLSRVLPAYLVPTAMVTVDAFPLTSAGKLNVRALPPPVEETAAADPRPGPETTIAEIFAGLLGRPVNRDDDFFLSGGHSLAAVKAVARIRASVGVEVTIRTLFANPTVAALAAAIHADAIPADVIHADVIHVDRGDSDTPETSGDPGMPGAVPAPPGRLSGPQHGLWIIHQAGQDDGAYVVHAAFRLEGVLDEADLRARFAHTLATHPALRSAVVVHDGTPWLSAAPRTDELPARAWRTTDLSAHVAPWPEAERLAARDADHPFDLTRRPLVRAHLIRTAPTTHLLTITAHHIICDDTSMSILLSTLTTVDPVLSPLSGATDVQGPVPAPGTKAGAPGLSPLTPAALGPRQRTTEFWAETLRDAPPASGPSPDHPYGTAPTSTPGGSPYPESGPSPDSGPSLDSGPRLDSGPSLDSGLSPESGPRPAHSRRTGAAPGATHRFTVPAGLARRFATWCRGERATTFAGLLAVFAIVSSTRDGGDDLVVGVPVGTRPAGLDDVIGMFVTTLPLRLRTDHRATPRDLIADAAGVVADAMDHADISPADILSTVPTSREGHPLFRTMLVLNRETAPVTFTGLTATPLPIDRATSRFDLTLHIREREGEWPALIDYRTDRYEADTITRIADQVLAVMEAVVRHPGLPLSHQDLLSPADSAVHTALHTRPGPAFPGGPDTPSPGPAAPARPAATTVVDLIAARTVRTPDATAVLDLAAAPLTYRELDRRSSAVARHLREAGIRSEDPVAITVPAGADAIIAILGVLKAGGCFVPIDPAQPSSRQQALITASGARAVLTRDGLPAAGHHEPTPIHPSQLAYVVHTSGSTGEPKGVEVQHDTLLDLTTAFIAEHALTAGQRLLMVPPPHFDAAYGDIFPVLAAGATLVIHPDPGGLTGRDLLGLCVEHRLSAVDTASPLWQRWVADLAGERLPLEIMMVGGDVVPAATVRAWAKHGIPLHNHYGPTEATVCATSHRTVDGREHPTRLPIGRPLRHVRVHLLDRALRRVPVGVVGEVYIGGTAPARGYRGNPAATAAAFLADPYGDRPGARMYRTGDLARLNPHGTLEFVGRADDQVKIRGNRVEPGEVAAVLAAHPAVAEAVVVARGDRLIGYVGAPPGTAPPGTAPPGTTPDPQGVVPQGVVPDVPGLRAFCAARLPAHLVPDTVVVLDALPTTSTGKVDGSALPEPPTSPTGRTVPADPPRTATERAVAAIWATVLDRSDVDRTADFFAIGGHSLIAAHVLAGVRDRLGVTVPMRTLFTAPTVAAFAAAIDDGAPADLPTVDRLRADAVPPPEIRLRTVHPPGIPSAGTPRRILLTGATGFLGRHLLGQLLARTDARIHCLVRPGSIDRLPVTDRVIPVPGDLSAPGLGLSTEDHDTLTTVDAIFHNAAVPHFAAPYHALKPAHVDATAAILRLAGDSGAPLHLISTLGVFLGDAHDGRVVTEADAPTDPSGLTSGYDLSKWVADAMASDARDHGLPVSIHRIAAIVGDTATGAADPRSAFSRWLTGCVAAGAVPDTAEVLDMVPVDTVAAAIVALSQVPDHFCRDYHYHGDGGLDRAALAAALTSAGHPTEVVPYHRWRERMLADPAGPFAPLAFSLPERPRPHPRFDCSRTWAAAAGAGVGFPPADERMLLRHLDFLTGAGALSGSG